MLQTKRFILTVFGSVQGVGFRPFVFRLANQHNLAGHIRNTTKGVEIDVQGDIQSLANFQQHLVSLKPERSCISELVVEEKNVREYSGFTIVESKSHQETSLALLPDSAMCSECLQELYDPNNRRYRYPFLHCMTCGPRFSLFTAMPFDRAHTTMCDFSMCTLCREEYNTPSNRRFYTQTNCCPECGPELRLTDRDQNVLACSEDAIMGAAEQIRQGKIVALKNTGGYLLIADAANDETVTRLRHLKRRPKKPFALMVPDLAFAKEVAFVNEAAEKILTSPAAPIVLLKKRGQTLIATSATFESPYFGIMLPHNPIHYLLLNELHKPLVATSGNISGNPLCITEEEAFLQLSGIAEYFLIHNRRITHRLDDSVVHIIHNQPMVMRRSRGYIPYAIDLRIPQKTCTLATGGHQKSSFAIAKDRRLYVSQHIGTLDSYDTCRSYDEEIKSWEALLHAAPARGICDIHPDYYTSRYLQSRNVARNFIQHHKAHVFSCMADNTLTAPLLGISWDGTGLGDDQTIWGAEAFTVTEHGIQHFASLLPFGLPGSEKAIREPRRAALGLLHELFGTTLPDTYHTWTKSVFTKEELAILSKGVNTPLCSSMGRLFDAVSALLGCCLFSEFEGHAASLLEALAIQCKKQVSPYPISLDKRNDIWLLDWRDMIQQLFEDTMQKRALEEISLSFHLTLVEALVLLAKQSGLKMIVLTGGVMQNKLLAENAICELTKWGFSPFSHHNIPPNDAGLAVGQIWGAIQGGIDVSSTAG